MQDNNSGFGKAWKILTTQREVPRITIVFPIVIYILLSALVVLSGQYEGQISIGSYEVPPSAFTGALASLANVALVYMVLNYKRLGFVVSLAGLLLQLPKIIIWIFVQHNALGIPAVFTTLFTILMLVIIMLNHVKMEREHERLRILFDQTAKSLVNAIDTKDKYTQGHSSRVAGYSKKLAEMNGKTPSECDAVFYAALLHDVGKIGVPSSIINKDGKLSEDEYETVKGHPVMGAQILEQIKAYPYLREGARYHHENYDGTGYPEGLKGDAIPENARIIAIADAYDAMTSKRSYRDPMPQDRVREEIVKGIGTQFDAVYARLMLQLIDQDTEYEMKEKSDKEDTGSDLTITEYRSIISDGILVNPYMTTISLAVSSDDETSGIAPVPSLVLFDSLDGVTHSDEKDIESRCYFEYGELWFDGRSEKSGARKMQTRTFDYGSADVKLNGEYMISAVRVRDHAMVRIAGKAQTFETVIALPDSTRFMYIGITGSHCNFTGINITKSEDECSEDYIPRIAEVVSYIDFPEGDVPNIQIDGPRTASSKGIAIKDGLKISFHTKSLPIARLVWHCPFIDIFSSEDGTVGGTDYTDLALVRFDGESWACDRSCSVDLDVRMGDAFKNWEKWKEFNLAGYDATVSFEVRGNKVTVITENGGISIRNTVKLAGGGKNIYAAVTGDQVAVTNIRIAP